MPLGLHLVAAKLALIYPERLGDGRGFGHSDLDGVGLALTHCKILPDPPVPHTGEAARSPLRIGDARFEEAQPIGACLLRHRPEAMHHVMRDVRPPVLNSQIVMVTMPDDPAVSTSRERRLAERSARPDGPR